MRGLLKHAVRSVIRFPAGNAAIAFVIFSMMLLVFICMSIQVGVEKELLEVRERLGNEVILTPEFPQIKSDAEQAAVVPSQPYVPGQLGRKLLNSPYVTDVNFYLWTTVSSVLNPAVIQSPNYKVTLEQSTIIAQKDSVIKKDSTAQKDSATQYETIIEKENIEQKVKAVPKNIFILKGYSKLELQSEFKTGRIKLTEGEFFTNSSAVMQPAPAVISRPLAEKNHYKLGSTFTIEVEGADYEQEMRVTGIFDEAEPKNESITYVLVINNIFTSLEAVKSISRYSQPTLPDDAFTSVSYFFETPLHMDAFKHEAKANGLDQGKYKLDEHDSEYERITGLLRSFKLFSVVLMIMALVGGTIILNAILFHFYKRRRKEMVIMQSIGVAKRSIVYHFVMELLLVSFLTLAAAGIIGLAFTQSISSAMLREQISVTGWLDKNSKSIYAAGEYSVAVSDNLTGIIVYGNSDFAQNAGAVLKEIKTIVDFRQILQYLLSYMCIMLCTCFTIWYFVMRHQPMAILLMGHSSLKSGRVRNYLNSKVADRRFHERKSSGGEFNVSVISSIQKAGATEVDEVIRLEDVEFGYEKKDKHTGLIRQSCGAFFSGRVYAVTGQSIEAKTILLLLMVGLLPTDKGKIYFRGAEIGTMNPNAYRCKQIGIILKACPVVPELTVLENAELSMENAGFSKNKRKERVLDLLKKIGFDSSKTGLKAAKLNPVEQQAIAIVRALGPKPALLFVEAIDWSTCPELEAGMLELLIQAAHAEGVCVMMTTDSRNYANRVDDVWGVKDGILLPLIID